MKICTRCVLPETFPGITFNRDGVCRFCIEYERKGKRGEEEGAERIRERFLKVVEEVRGRGGYHCLHALSGGKDSTFTLHLLVKVHKLRVLSLTFDNGFLSPSALENIKRVGRALPFDHLIVRPDPSLLKRIFRLCSHEEIFPPKTLQRASSICTACVGLIKGIVMREAIEKGIPLVSFGWSPGQTSRVASFFRMNSPLLKGFQNSILLPLRERIGPDVDRFFPGERHLEEGEFPFHISPLSFEDYREERMMKTIQGYGWTPPAHTDPNSTNCLLNSYANAVHIKRYGYNPYAMEVATLVREGALERGEALKRLSEGGEPSLIGEIERILFTEGGD